MEVKLAFIDHLLGLERRVCRIYEKWAANESFSDDIRSFWREMADDEKRHLAILEQSAGLLNFAASAPPTSSGQRERITREISTAERASDNPERPIEEVFGQAIALESSELNQLDDAWVRGFPPELGNLMEAWTPAHDQHIRRLAAAVRRFTISESLHEAAAALLSQHGRKKRAYSA